MRRPNADEGETHLLGHDSSGRKMLNFLHTAPVALAELLEVLEVLIPEVVVLVLGVELEVGKRRREGRVVCTAMSRCRARRWRRVRAIYRQKVALGIDARCVGRDLGGGELHGRGPLLPATCGYRCGANGLWLGLRGWLGDIELEGFEVALLAHGASSGGHGRHDTQSVTGCA